MHEIFFEKKLVFNITVNNFFDNNLLEQWYTDSVFQTNKQTKRHRVKKNCVCKRPKSE